MTAISFSILLPERFTFFPLAVWHAKLTKQIYLLYMSLRLILRDQCYNIHIPCADVALGWCGFVWAALRAKCPVVHPHHWHGALATGEKGKEATCAVQRAPWSDSLWNGSLGSCTQAVWVAFGIMREVQGGDCIQEMRKRHSRKRRGTMEVNQEESQVHGPSLTAVQ